MLHIAYPGKYVKGAVDAGRYGGIAGSDFAGVVEEVGPDVPNGLRTVSERVAGYVKGGQFLLL